MNTYTIALIDGALYGVVPDGGDIKDEVMRVLASVDIDPEQFDLSGLESIKGCALTDEVKESDEVIYQCGDVGYLYDEHGGKYSAAVIRK
jgi:hypothetical protein